MIRAALARAARIIKSSIIILRPLCVGGDDRHDRVHGRVHVGKVRVRRPFLIQTRPCLDQERAAHSHFTDMNTTMDTIMPIITTNTQRS